MKISVQMYAVLKDYFGDSLQFDFQNGATVNDLTKVLLAKKPESSSILDKCRFAVNQEFAACEHELQSGDKIDILPPSSGG